MVPLAFDLCGPTQRKEHPTLHVGKIPQLKKKQIKNIRTVEIRKEVPCKELFVSKYFNIVLCRLVVVMG
jgi:hypothetical protein